MAPEQASGGQADARSDQYAIALILYYLLTKRQPFARLAAGELRRAIAAGNVPRASTHRPDNPAELDDAIARGMSVDLAARFANVHELGAAIYPFASENGRAQWKKLFTNAAPTPVQVTGQPSGPAETSESQSLPFRAVPEHGARQAA